MGCSGPGATNLLTGVANAFTDARAAGGHRRLEPARLSRHGGLPGDRPGRRVPPRHEVDGADLRRQAHSRHGRTRRSARRPRAGPAPSTSTCRATSWARRSRRSSSSIRRRGARRRARWAIPNAIREAIALLAQGRAPGGHRGQRRVVVRRRGRAPGLRRGHRHPLLHHADLARPHPGGPRAGVPERAQQGLHRGRRGAGGGHALQLGHPVRPPAALRRRPQGDPRGRQPDPARPQPRRGRAHRRRRARGARAAPRGGRGQDRRPSATRPGRASSARSTPRSRRRAGQGHVQRRRRRSTRCGSARRCATSSGATPSWSWTARRS